jgi:hypothetical protein
LGEEERWSVTEAAIFPEARLERQGAASLEKGAFEAAMHEAVGVSVNFQDIDVVGNAIQQGAGEPLGAEDIGPLIEENIVGDQHRGAFIALADGFKKQFGAGLRYWT